MVNKLTIESDLIFKIWCVCVCFVHKLLFSKLKKKNRNIITLKTEHSLISFYRTLRLNEVNIAYKCDHNHPSPLNQWKHIGDDAWVISLMNPPH